MAQRTHAPSMIEFVGAVQQAIHITITLSTFHSVFLAQDLSSLPEKLLTGKGSMVSAFFVEVPTEIMDIFPTAKRTEKTSAILLRRLLTASEFLNSKFSSWGSPPGRLTTPVPIIPLNDYESNLPQYNAQ